MRKPNLAKIEKELEDKTARRERKRKPKMKVDGAKNRGLARIIAGKTKN